MIIQYLVTVKVGPMDEQPKKEFEKEDGKDMGKYLREKIEDSISGSWQWNAEVERLNVKQIKIPKPVRFKNKY